ncbi:autotransporter outer membrane beta-barrel domain-containing protein, partial [Bartonella sp. LJL80]
MSDIATGVTAATGESCTANSSSYTGDASQPNVSGVVQAVGIGAVLDATSVTTIKATKDGGQVQAHGVYASNGGVVHLGSNVSIEAVGNRSSAIRADGAGSKVIVGGNVSTVIGSSAYTSNWTGGVWVASGGYVEIDGKLTVRHHSLPSGSNAVHGAVANAGSTIKLQDFDYEASSPGSYGLYADGAGAILTARNVLITQTNNKFPFPSATGYAYGIYATNSASIEIVGGTLANTGTLSVSNSLIRVANNASFTSTGTLNLTAIGAGSRGIYVSGGAVASINDTNIISEVGSLSSMAAPSIQIAKSRPMLTGDGGLHSYGALNVKQNSQYPAIYIEGESLLKADYATSSTIIDSAQTAIIFGAADETVANKTIATISLSNAKVTNRGNYDLITVGGNVSDGSVLSVANSEMRAANGAYLISVQSGVINDKFESPKAEATSSFLLKADGRSNLYGMVDIKSTTTPSNSATLNLEFDNESIWHLVANTKATDPSLSKFTKVEVKNGSTIDASSGNFVLQGDVLSNGGIIDLIGDDPVNSLIVGKNLTINGNYDGQSNALVKMNVTLGDDSSPTDFLHITGNATGTTGVQVVNRGGLGALTTGDGIQLIKVDGTSSADNFSLKSDYSFEGQAAVVGGAYAYSLYAGNKAGDFAGDWYLRSLYVKPVEPPQPPVGPVEPPVIEPKPVYSAVVPMYEVYPQILQQLNKLGTLEQRIGNRTWIGTGSDRQTATINEMEGRGFWMKVEGSTGHINSNVS